MIPTSPPRPKIGLLALTLELYESLLPSLRASREAWLRHTVIPALGSHTDVQFQGALFRREDIDAAVASFEAGGADALLVILLTYSLSQLALPALQRSRLPIVIWNTQELLAVDQSFTAEAMIDNHGVHGTQDLANVLTRAGVPFQYITSPPADRQGLEELRDFFAAAAAVRRLRSARIGLLGYPFPGMGDFAVDTTHLATTLGCSWTNLTVEEYILRSAAAPNAIVASVVAEYRHTYEVAADVTDADLTATARAELALRGMVQDQRLDALTYQFTAFGDDERVATLPFVAASRLMGEGVGFGGEGDLIGAAATAFFSWLNPPASFSEMFTIDFAGDSLFMSHMGEANVRMARRDRKVPLVARHCSHHTHPRAAIGARHQLRTRTGNVRRLDPRPRSEVASHSGPGHDRRLWSLAPFLRAALQDPAAVRSAPLPNRIRQSGRPAPQCSLFR